MSQRYIGGFITKSPTTPTSNAAPGIWTLDQAMQYIKAGTWPTPPIGDQYFQYTNLLLGTGSTNGAQNNTFLDSSSNAFSITRNGNTTQGSFTPFSQAAGYWSGYFDGTGDYLTIPGSTNFINGSGSFTIEGWVCLSATPTTSGVTFYSQDSGAAAIRTMSIVYNNGSAGSWKIWATSSGSSWDIANDVTFGTYTLPVGQWVHFAVVRNGTNLKLYINGYAQGAGVTLTGSIESTSSYNFYAFGQFQSPSGSGGLPGFISNYRVVKGTAVYTSDFTPSTTPLTAITNTALLTCQSNYFVDNSTNAFAITPNGNAAIIPFQPFGAPTSPYNTPNIGGSGYFDGTGDYLSTANSSSFAFGTGDFTIECWVYLTGGTSNDFADVDGGSTGYWLWNIYSGTMYWQSARAATNLISVALSNYQNQWVHFAVVRNSGTTKIYQNGIQIGSASDSTNYNGTAGNLRVGYAGITALTGYISNFRIVKGTAVYTSNFTPPTAPLAAITNTSLLCNFTNAAIFDSAAKNDMETAGNAQVSTSVTKFGNSAYFDGSGDYLAMPNSPNFDMSSGEFTIEGWMYQTSSTGDQVICAKYEPSYQSSWYIGTSSTNWAVYTYYGSTSNLPVYTGTAPSLNTWHHFALVRCGNRTMFYVDGVQLANVASQTMRATTSGVSIGRTGAGYTEYFYGYLSNIRITKGVGRYPYNFTPPTQAFGTIYKAEPTPAADPYFDYTTLLLPGSGTNGAQNNTFLDSSASPFTITRNGNTTQGTFSPFSQTGWSNYFDASGDSITTSANTALQLGSGSFTLEFWAYRNSVSGSILQLSAGTDDYSPLFGYPVGTTLQVYLSSNNSSWDIASGVSMGTLPVGEWAHFAVTRSGNTFRTFKNGTLISTFSSSASLYQKENQVSVGKPQGGTASFDGYISNLRLVKGTAVYTANFTVPTEPLTAITNTSLLTCQSNRFVDNSTNALTFTVSGTPSAQAFSPFNPTAAYSAATVGGSGYFDGTGDYLTTTTSVSLAGDFTIETWEYQTNPGTRNSGVIGIGDGANSGTLILYIDTNQYMNSYFNGSNIGTGGGAGYAPANTWNHYALVRSGSTVYYYLNGKQVYSFTGTGTISGTLYVGGSLFSSVIYAGQGYMAGTRILNGTALYTGSTYTVPTAPLTAIANTAFLANYTNAGIIDATAKNDLETGGNAQISNTVAKWGSTSMYFDGTGDYLISPNSQNLILGTGDFTVEAWVYPTTANYQTIVCLGRYLYNVGVLRIQDDNTVRWYFNDNSVGVTTTNKINLNAWNHICASRYGGVTKVFINGVQGGSFSDSSNYNSTYATVIAGEDQGSSPTNLLTGYLQDVRITKGIARYTQNFTPPAAAFQLL